MPPTGCRRITDNSRVAGWPRRPPHRDPDVCHFRRAPLPPFRSRRHTPHDAGRAPRQPVAGGHLRAAHAGLVPGAAGVRAGGGAPARRQRPGAGRAGHGHLRADAGGDAGAAGAGVGPRGAQEDHRHRPRRLRARQRGGGAGGQRADADRRPRDPGRGRGVCRRDCPAGRPDARRSAHQRHGAGGHQHRGDVCAVAGGRAAAGRGDWAGRLVLDHRAARRGRHRRGALVDAGRTGATR